MRCKLKLFYFSVLCNLYIICFSSFYSLAFDTIFCISRCIYLIDGSRREEKTRMWQTSIVRRVKLYFILLYICQSNSTFDAAKSTPFLCHRFKLCAACGRDGASTKTTAALFMQPHTRFYIKQWHRGPSRTGRL